MRFAALRDDLFLARLVPFVLRRQLNVTFNLVLGCDEASGRGDQFNFLRGEGKEIPMTGFLTGWKITRAYTA